MKIEMINTGVIVPGSGRYGYNEVQEEKKQFEKAICAALGLPENWNKYFQFDSSKNFITLKENGSYNTASYRQFSRGKEATISAEKKQDLFDRIEYVETKEKRENNLAEQREFYLQMVNPIIAPLNADNWTVCYYNNDGVEIEMHEAGKPQSYCTKLTKVVIKHNGEITKPSFDISYRYKATLEQIQAWIDINTPLQAEIMAKAQEVKGMLPSEFFTPKTQP